MSPAPTVEYPPEVYNAYSDWTSHLSPDGQNKLGDLMNTSQNPPSSTPFTLSESLGTTDPNIAPIGSDNLSLKGQLQGLYGNHLFENSFTNVKDYNNFLVTHNIDPNDQEWQKVWTEMVNGKQFDPFDGKHLQIRDMIMQDKGITPDEYDQRVNALYAYVKRNTPPVNFPSNPDYFDRTKGIVLPASLNKWWTDLEQIK